MNLDDEELSQTQALKYIEVSLPTLIRYRNTGRLPATRKGGRWFYKRTDLDRIINGEAALETAPVRRIKDLLAKPVDALVSSERRLRTLADEVETSKMGELQASAEAVLIIMKTAATAREGIGAARHELERAGGGIADTLRHQIENDLALIENDLARKDERVVQVLRFLVQAAQGLIDKRPKSRTKSGKGSR